MVYIPYRGAVINTVGTDLESIGFNCERGMRDTKDNYIKHLEESLKSLKEEYSQYVTEHEDFYIFIQEKSKDSRYFRYLGMRYADIAVDMIKQLEKENQFLAHALLKYDRRINYYADKDNWCYSMGSGNVEIKTEDWYTDRERLKENPNDYRWVGGKGARQAQTEAKEAIEIARQIVSKGE